MKRASYHEATYWIAVNDNAGNGDTAAEVEQYVTTKLVADLWGLTPEQVARDVVSRRLMMLKPAHGVEVPRG